MTDPLLLRTDHGPVRVLTLNRPAQLNSFTAELHGLLRAALDEAAADVSVRCVVLTGAGRGFCAGQDLNEDGMSQPDADVGGVVERLYKPLVLRIRSMPVPVLAMVNGVAAGAGANVALACDVVVAARSASFIQAFSKIALVPDAGGTWLLPRLVGRARALGLTFFGDKLPAADAAAQGLIWRCVDDAALADEALALAQRLAAMPAAALVATRQLIDEAVALPLEDALSAEARAQAKAAAAPDFSEGVTAFREKRAPRFSDR